jgi:hypothetical protein
MYRGYYRQRKIGRVFSFLLVTGSGLSHYAKAIYSSGKDKVSVENLIKYEEYMPNNLKDILKDYLQIKQDNVDGINKIKKKMFSTEKSFERQNDYWKYKKNLEHSMKEDYNYKCIPLYITKDEAKLEETYKIIELL